MKMYSDANITKEEVQQLISQLKQEIADLVISNQTYVLSQASNQKLKITIAMVVAFSALAISAVSLYLQLA